MTCPKCNQKIDADVNFCPNCGEKTCDITTEAEASEKLCKVTPNSSSSQIKHKNKKKLYIIIASILAAIVIIILAIVFQEIIVLTQITVIQVMILHMVTKKAAVQTLNSKPLQHYIKN